MPARSAFIDALCSAGPAPDRADRMALYGFLVGRWAIDARYHLDDGATKQSRGEIHAAWVLAGRAIQDVWIVPERDGRAETPPPGGAFYGTTLRIYDPGLDAWHILWSDPVRQFYGRMIGRAQGRDIVQEGTADDGTRIRWSFRDITATSFHWIGERRDDVAAAWGLRTEYFARRL